MNDVPIDTHRAVLADGSKVDLETTEGADAFLKEYPNFFSKHSGTANVYRQLLASVGKHKYGGKNDIVRMLKQVYRVAGALAANASEKAVGNLDTTELETFVLHIESVLKALTTQDEWTCTGVFNRCDSVMIGALAQLIHRGVADTFVEEKYCTLVADVVASAKRCATRLPSAESFFYMIAPIVHLLFAGEKKTETQMRLARSGLLTQFVRFLTHPKLEPASGEEISKQVIGVCMTAPFLIKEVFHTSRPGGKILRDVLAGKDGHPGDRSPEATALLHALVQMADWTNMFYNTSPCVVCSNKSRKPVLCRYDRPKVQHSNYQSNPLTFYLFSVAARTAFSTAVPNVWIAAGSITSSAVRRHISFRKRWTLVTPVSHVASSTRTTTIL
jgi:hypothetical protein